MVWIKRTNPTERGVRFDKQTDPGGAPNRSSDGCGVLWRVENEAPVFAIDAASAAGSLRRLRRSSSADGLAAQERRAHSADDCRDQDCSQAAGHSALSKQERRPL